MCYGITFNNARFQAGFWAQASSAEAACFILPTRGYSVRRRRDIHQPVWHSIIRDNVYQNTLCVRRSHWLLSYEQGSNLLYK